MSVRTAEASSRSLSAEAVLPFLLAAVIYAVLMAAGDKLLNDPDTYWHLAVGDWIVSHRAFPTVDPFSATFAGQPWIAKEWLSQLLYAGAHALGGWGGMAALAAAAAALTFGLLTRVLIERLRLVAAVLFVAAAFVLVTPHLVARPHALALPVMVAWTAGLVSAIDGKRAPSLWLLPLMALWANLHGGFIFGIVLVAATGLEAVVSAAPADRRRVGLSWLVFAGGTVLAACITPYGPGSIFAAMKVLSLGPALATIGEWHPAGFGRIGALEVVLLLGLGAAMWRGFRLAPVRILIVLGLVHMALSADRNAEVFGLLLPLFLATPLASQYPAMAAETSPVNRLSWGVGAALFVATAVLATVLFGPGLSPNARITPSAAVAALKSANAGPVFNDYDFGGYLVYAGIPPFIDGRTELYGADFFLEHNRAATLADLPGLVAMLDRYRIGATLLNPQTPAVAFLDRLPGWHRLYADDIAVVHVRDAAR